MTSGSEHMLLRASKLSTLLSFRGLGYTLAVVSALIFQTSTDSKEIKTRSYRPPFVKSINSVTSTYKPIKIIRSHAGNLPPYVAEYWNVSKVSLNNH